MALLVCGLLGTAGVLQLFGNGGLIAWVLAAFLLLGARYAVAPRRGELGVVLRCVATLLACVALMVAGLFVAWESAEVAVLRQADGRGGQVEDRLWVVDLDGRPVVATGSLKERVARVRANPEVELVRGGRAECRRAVVITESDATGEERARVERRFEEKYGIRLQATRLLRVVFGSDPTEVPVVIRLDPCV